MHHKFHFQSSYPFKAECTNINFLPLRVLRFFGEWLAFVVAFMCVCVCFVVVFFSLEAMNLNIFCNSSYVLCRI